MKMCFYSVEMFKLLFKSEHVMLRQSATVLGWSWVAWYDTWLHIELTLKGAVFLSFFPFSFISFPFLSFPFLSFPFLFFSFLFFSFLFFSFLFFSFLFFSVLAFVLSASGAQAILLETTATRCTQPAD